jgi:hypothetical protein
MAVIGNQAGVVGAYRRVNTIIVSEVASFACFASCTTYSMAFVDHIVLSSSLATQETATVVNNTCLMDS